MVTKGFHQHLGVDFFETFNPVIKASTIRVVLSIAVTNGWLLRQLDFNNAFLNGHLEENVYMMQPPGYVHLSYPNYALTGNDSVLISTLIKSLDKQFALKDLGRLTYFLGFQVNYLESGFILNQGKYISDLLHKLQLSDLKPAPSSSVVGKNLFAFGGTPLEDPFVYRNTIGALQYLTNTRPDIAYIINQLSQFLQKPTDLHWQAVKCVLKYLSGTKSFGLMFQQGDDLAISAYSDADWASNINDRKSIAAYCIFIGNTLVFWSSKKQTVVARSSTKSEYRALALVASEVIWLKQLLLELTSYPSRKLVIWCDNISSGALAMNPVFHARTKHIEIDVHFVRDQVLKGALEVRYVSSVD
ncbi:putative mitochondrial protein [Cucumis melo var. makuwa]|uniref:Mitochondrial protein n=1 Tax=Cucumis melo var. makuwa TaxID=1194695 RepID=A0A5D3DKK9_CUCMM|nr:putative mitochondrial protein [Cucumis melo var. makuwa]TYK24147.1 putative mitochondrial protein [Cucumis melo var. makuwa]